MYPNPHSGFPPAHMSQPGFNPNLGPPSYNPNPGPPSYNPNLGPPSYNPNMGQAGYNPNMGGQGGSGPNYHWVNSSKGQPAPPNGVVCGRDKDGSEIYVGLAQYSGDEIPAKIIPKRREAYVSYDGKELPITDYKILVEKKLNWVHNTGGHIPPGAVPAGRTASGEPLYVGRRRVDGDVISVGKVHPSHGCVYIPYGGKELSFKDYELLVYQ